MSNQLRWLRFEVMWRRTTCFVLMWLSPLSLWVTVGCLWHRQSIDGFGGSDIRNTFGHQKCSESFCECLDKFSATVVTVPWLQASVWLDKIWDTSERTCWVIIALFIKRCWTLLAFGNMVIFPVLIPGQERDTETKNLCLLLQLTSEFYICLKH